MKIKRTLLFVLIIMLQFCDAAYCQDTSHVRKVLIAEKIKVIRGRTQGSKEKFWVHQYVKIKTDNDSRGVICKITDSSIFIKKHRIISEVKIKDIRGIAHDRTALIWIGACIIVVGVEGIILFCSGDFSIITDILTGISITVASSGIPLTISGINSLTNKINYSTEKGWLFYTADSKH